MTDREKLTKIKNILEKYKENYIICFDKPLWNVVKKILALCSSNDNELLNRKEIIKEEKGK